MATGSVSVEERARRKGRAYQCLRCLDRTGKETIDVKYRIEDHILKVHLSLDEVPFYCSLCMFRCMEEADLVAHVTSYRKHRLMAADSPQLDTSSCLVKTSDPHIIGEADYRVLGQEESREHWVRVMRPKADPLQEAVDRVFPDRWLAAHAEDAASVQSHGTVRSSQPQPAQPTTTDSQAPMVLLTKQLQGLTEQTKLLVEATSASASTSSRSVGEWVNKLPLQRAQEENILPQILGQGGKRVIEEPQKETPRPTFEAPQKRARSVSPSSVASSASTSAVAAAIREEGKELRKMLGDTIRTNESLLTEVRDALQRQTDALNNLAQSISALAAARTRGAEDRAEMSEEVSRRESRDSHHRDYADSHRTNNDRASRNDRDSDDRRHNWDNRDDRHRTNSRKRSNDDRYDERDERDRRDKDDEGKKKRPLADKENRRR